jgi:hypothetical protein
MLRFRIFYNPIKNDRYQNNQCADVELRAHLFFFFEDDYGENNTVDWFEVDGEHDGIWTQKLHDFDGSDEGVGGTK